MTTEKAYKSAMGYVDTWKKIMEVVQKNTNKESWIYYNFAQSFLRIVINLYYSSFSKYEKKKFDKIRLEMKDISKRDLSKWDKGTKMFLQCPFVYGQYRAVRIKLSNGVK